MPGSGNCLKTKRHSLTFYTCMRDRYPNEIEGNAQQFVVFRRHIKWINIHCKIISADYRCSNAYYFQITSNFRSDGEFYSHGRLLLLIKLCSAEIHQYFPAGHTKFSH